MAERDARRAFDPQDFVRFLRGWGRAAGDVDDLFAAVRSARAEGSAIDVLSEAVAVSEEMRLAAERLLDRSVAEARADGHSWGDIGAVLGVSKQAAQQRFIAPGRRPAPRSIRKALDRFGPAARTVVMEAAAHAVSFEHRYLGTEHLLMALTAAGGRSEGALATFGMTSSVVRERIEREIGRGTGMTGTNVAFTPRAKRALVLGLRTALRRKAATVEPDHILMGIVLEGAGVAARWLSEVGATAPALQRSLGAAEGA